MAETTVFRYYIARGDFVPSFIVDKTLQSSTTTIAKGTLLVRKERQRTSLDSEVPFTVEFLDGRGFKFKCHKTDVVELSEADMKWLAAVRKPTERVNLLDDKAKWGLRTRLHVGQSLKVVKKNTEIAVTLLGIHSDDENYGAISLKVKPKQSPSSECLYVALNEVLHMCDTQTLAGEQIFPPAPAGQSDVRFDFKSGISVEQSKAYLKRNWTLLVNIRTERIHEFATMLKENGVVKLEENITKFLPEDGKQRARLLFCNILQMQQMEYHSVLILASNAFPTIHQKLSQDLIGDVCTGGVLNENAGAVFKTLQLLGLEDIRKQIENIIDMLFSLNYITADQLISLQNDKEHANRFLMERVVQGSQEILQALSRMMPEYIQKVSLLSSALANGDLHRDVMVKNRDYLVKNLNFHQLRTKLPRTLQPSGLLSEKNENTGMGILFDHIVKKQTSHDFEKVFKTIASGDPEIGEYLHLQLKETAHSRMQSMFITTPDISSERRLAKKKKPPSTFQSAQFSESQPGLMKNEWVSVIEKKQGALVEILYRDADQLIKQLAKRGVFRHEKEQELAHIEGAKEKMRKCLSELIVAGETAYNAFMDILSIKEKEFAIKLLTEETAESANEIVPMKFEKSFKENEQDLQNRLIREIWEDTEGKLVELIEKKVKDLAMEVYHINQDVLKLGEMEMIQAMKAGHQKATSLINYMKDRGKPAYDIFCQALGKLDLVQAKTLLEDTWKYKEHAMSHSYNREETVHQELLDYEALLEQHKDRLTELLHPDRERLLDCLVWRDVLNKGEIIKAYEKNKSKLLGREIPLVVIIIDKLKKKGKEGFHVLLEALDLLEKEYAAKMLREAEAKGLKSSQNSLHVYEDQEKSQTQRYTGKQTYEKGHWDALKKKLKAKPRNYAEIVARHLKEHRILQPEFDIPDDEHRMSLLIDIAQRHGDLGYNILEKSLNPVKYERSNKENIRSMNPDDQSGRFEQSPSVKLNSVVRVQGFNNEPGLVRWKGLSSDGSPVVGVEMFDKVPGGTDGAFFGLQYFRCTRGKGVLVHFNECRPGPSLDTRVAKR